MLIQMVDLLPGDLCEENGIEFIILFRTEGSMWIKEIDPLPFGVRLIHSPAPIWPNTLINILGRGLCCPLPQVRQWIEAGVYERQRKGPGCGSRSLPC